MKQYLPHIITLTSLCIGCLSIIESSKLNLTIASYLIIVSCILDGLDGFFARLLKTESQFGKQLDSFSDLVNFGMAPGFIMYFFLNDMLSLQRVSYLSLLIPIFATLRLANYNTQKKITNNFSGITTPVIALVFASIPLINQYHSHHWLQRVLVKPEVITSIIVISCLLLLAPIKTFGLRFDTIIMNKRKMIFLFISICILYIFKYIGILIIILMYILLNVFRIIDK